MTPAVRTLLLRPGPSLDLDFTAGALTAPVTLARAGAATYFDSAGVLQSASTDVARFDYDMTTLVARGLLIEAARTNSIRNNTMVGAVAGTPGTLPTNWFSTVLDGVARTVVGTGTENGLTYIDMQFSTATVTSGARSNLAWLSAETSTSAAAVSGQNWSTSWFIKIQAGSAANLTFGMTVSESNSGGTFLAQTNTAIVPTATLTRFTTSRTLSQATCAFTNTSILASYGSGVAINITLRLYLPQLEQGAFATSVIPTTGAAVTRAADIPTSVDTGWLTSGRGVAALTVHTVAGAGANVTQPGNLDNSNPVASLFTATPSGRYRRIRYWR